MVVNSSEVLTFIYLHSLCCLPIGEVMVIVEYCRFGNLQNFLVKHRNYFVDQIMRDKDVIDPTILVRDQRWSGDSGYPYYNRYDFRTLFVIGFCMLSVGFGFAS